MWRRWPVTYPSRCISSSGEYADSGDGFCASLVGGAFYSQRVDSVGGGVHFSTGVLTPWEEGGLFIVEGAPCDIDLDTAPPTERWTHVPRPLEVKGQRIRHVVVHVGAWHRVRLGR